MTKVLEGMKIKPGMRRILPNGTTMTWQIAFLYACADCSTEFPATNDYRKAAWHYFIHNHRPLFAHGESWEEALERKMP